MKKITKETLIRALRTFIQAIVAYTIVELKAGVDFSSKEVLKGFVVGAIAAGIAGLMNLEPKKSELGAGNKMTYADFIKKYNGKSTDYDGVYGTQCVDLAKLYIDKVLGVKPESIGDAHSYYDNFDKTYLKKHFKKIPYKKGVKVKKGDLVVWGKKYNGKSENGHIAIATGTMGDDYIITYDQNWGSKAMKRVKHSLTGISGFLRPIEQDNINPSKSKTKPKKKESSKYFKKCNKSKKSFVDALSEIDVKNDFNYRTKIANANGFSLYFGTAKQNIALLDKLKEGKLIKP